MTRGKKNQLTIFGNGVVVFVSQYSSIRLHYEKGKYNPRVAAKLTIGVMKCAVLSANEEGFGVLFMWSK